MHTIYALAVSAFLSALILAPHAVAAWWERREDKRAWAETEGQGSE